MLRGARTLKVLVTQFLLLTAPPRLCRASATCCSAGYWQIYWTDQTL